jgi:hypothetical protein
MKSKVKIVKPDPEVVTKPFKTKSEKLAAGSSIIRSYSKDAQLGKKGAR